MRSLRILAMSWAWLLIQPAAAAAADPPVKKSTSGLCHERGTAFHERTKNFEPFDSMEACLQSGGQRPQGAAQQEAKSPAVGSSSRWPGKLAFVVLSLAIVGGSYLVFRRRSSGWRSSN